MSLCRHASRDNLDLASRAGTPRHWWPLIPVDYLKPDRPNPVTLLGITMVVWRDAGGRWRVFRDRCPHRLAPLSEGRVEPDGSLSCAYHGWRFDGSGACRRIPQAVDAASEAAACSSRRSCATAYPARVEFNMLWVWPDASPDAEAAAAATELVVSNDLRRRDKQFKEYSSSMESPRPSASSQKPPLPLAWYVRQVPYSYEICMENVLDPSHLPYSHHGHSPQLKRDVPALAVLQQLRMDFSQQQPQELLHNHRECLQLGTCSFGRQGRATYAMSTETKVQRSVTSPTYPASIPSQPRQAFKHLACLTC
ncbi:hypothetical protein VOLCADRAFT_89016 [Volvox carteri f. nagariensis]|uniref:Rieske domain-containing protein n=1 Tax=Volvox carteri f. nagariensis TaxID=3068 RepID=D8TQK3_VOLCA|nr:uncharacterized protein VOLCADRAFT_89016 [Volvox carteri f. nagariensis]EFJ50048.1 hypothetical protein VOLCADRAFT_89016 [Volvox carteri f. nagariensis]|eukprot:XP_002948668.1 hypothetical protein VOLCADRAFT_89016 [Volvox carteri f. nagariensis]